MLVSAPIVDGRKRKVTLGIGTATEQVVLGMTGPTERVAPHPTRRTQLRPFSARSALRFTAVLAGVHGLVLIVSPEFGLSLFDAPRAGDVGYWLRHYGVLFIALTVVFWSAAGWSSSMMQRPIMWAAGIVVTVLSFFGVLALLDGTMGPAFAVVVGVESILAVWFGWLLALDRV